MRVGAIIQARIGSTRLPGKVMRVVDGKPVLRHVVDRALMCETIPKVIVATTLLPQDRVIVDEIIPLGSVDAFRGDPEDVLDRYYRCAIQYDLEVIVRLTADCPVLDPRVVDRVVTAFHEGQPLDYAATGATYPEGYGVEVIRFGALKSAWKNALASSEREHVTPYIWNRPDTFRICKVEHSTDCSMYRLTLDEEKDWTLLSRLIPALSSEDPYFGIDQAVNFLKANPELAAINRGANRQAGYREAVRNEQKGL